jgi:hypothetical protein
VAAAPQRRGEDRGGGREMNETQKQVLQKLYSSNPRPLSQRSDNIKRFSVVKFKIYKCDCLGATVYDISN